MKWLAITATLVLALGVIGMAVTSNDNVFQGPLASSSWNSKVVRIQKAEGVAPLGGTHDCTAHHTSEWQPADPTDVKRDFIAAGDTIEFVCLVWSWTGCEPTGDTLGIQLPNHRVMKLANDWGGYCIPAGSWWLMYWAWFPPPRAVPGTYGWGHKLAGTTPEICRDGTFTLH